MARIGLKVGKYNLIDPETNKYKALSDSTVPMFRKLISASFEAEFNEAELYANDTLCENDYTFNKGTSTVTVDDDEDKFVAEILGLNKTTVSESGNEYHYNIKDNAPEIGFGQVITKKVNGKYQYKVEFLPRVKITDVVSEANTKGESVEFGTTKITGTVFAVDKEIGSAKIGDYKIIQTFDDFEKAEAYLDKLLTPSA